MTYQKFYHQVGKDPVDMDIDELHTELNACQTYERACIEIGQGINSKENLRERRIRKEIIRRLINHEITVGKAFSISGV